MGNDNKEENSTAQYVFQIFNFVYSGIINFVFVKDYFLQFNNEFQTNLNNNCSNYNINDWTLLFNVTTSKLVEIPT